MTNRFEALRLRTGRRPDLRDSRAGRVPRWGGTKRKAELALPELRADLDRLQELFFADARRGLLVVLQGMDTSGKDGVIRHVFEGVNPQGVRVSCFKAPTPVESSHDFLWRIHRRTPAKGEVVIFNRSHYEDVLVARVHGTMNRGAWSKRIDAINAFERELADDGITILKFFLHLSRDEQRRRLEDRLRDPAKQWKLSASDLLERRHWSRYRSAYEEVLSRTSHPWAPWYILPSDAKWFRNLAVSEILVGAMRSMGLRVPPPQLDLKKVRFD